MFNLDSESKDIVFLDTETTGLGERDEPIEIAILDYQGDILFYSLIKPSVQIAPDAFAVHGISDDDLKKAPRFHEIAPKLQSVLFNKKIMGWNVAFDLQMIRNTCIRQRCSLMWLLTCQSYCVKTAYSHATRGLRSNEWVSMAVASQELCIDTSQIQLHRALGDARVLRQIFIKN